MFSFIRTLQLIKKYVSNDKIEEVHDQFVRLMWGRGSQGIERNNPKADRDIKMSAYNELIGVFPFLKSKEKVVGNIIEEYYSNYKMS